MAVTENTYLLALAQTCESIALSERGVRTYPHNKTEVLASVLQALLMTLGGGDPASTAMPPEVGIIGLNDLVQVSQQKPNLLWQAFSVGFAFGTIEPGNLPSVAADGSAKTTAVYANGFTFPTSTNFVLVSIKNDYQANPWQLTAQATNYTTSGFDVSVGGAPGGSFVSLDYLAIGA